MNRSLPAKINLIVFASFFIALAIVANDASAQQEFDNWYFGSNAGLNFISGSPVNLTNGQVNTTEGSASVSDDAGNLLFYTDGVTVWNKLHAVMVNGNFLHGGLSSTQSALILKRPGSDSLYFIFTTGESLSYGLQYSIVDMSLQGGNGEVTVKNVNLVNNTAEKVTAAHHANNTDFWVITHLMNSSLFYSFELTASGVNTSPVVSNTGVIETSEVGYMKTSHKGMKIAVGVHSPGYFFELFDFNNSTGDVSNPVYLTPPASSSGPYGVEFSPNDSILYGSIYTPATVVQWDISSNDALMINASVLSVGLSSNTFIGALQLASDGKIYVAKYIDSFLGVIDNPNEYGMGCNYIDNGYNLTPKQSQLGLPNFLPAAFEENLLPGSSFIAGDTNICQKFCIDFFDSSTNDPDAWQWFFPGGSPTSSADKNPANICYNNPGSYDVTLITTNAFGSDTVTFSNYIVVNPTPPNPVITVNDSVLTSSPAPSYQWQYNSTNIAGATNQSYTATQTGLYTVLTADENGCTSSASQYMTITGIEEMFSDENVLIYPNPSNGEFMVEWLNGQTNAAVQIQIHNILGQLVFSSEEKNYSDQFSKNINLALLNRGIYFIEISAWSRSENNEVFQVKKKIIIAK